VESMAGMGLRGAHYQVFLQTQPAVGWVEVHAENFFGGGRTPAYLEKVRTNYSVSLHGVALSLGSPGGLDEAHLRKLKQLHDRVEPFLVSEHLAWSRHGEAYLNDLLPLPYTQEALAVVCENIHRLQEVLGRQVLIENPSLYMDIPEHEMEEGVFLAELVKHTGCGLLLDVNNFYVSCQNLGKDLLRELSNTPLHKVQEIHVAGHSLQEVEGEAVRIDDHGSAVSEAVWHMLEEVVGRIGPRPTLVEWDRELPEMEMLLGEVSKAEAILQASVQEKRYAR